MLYAPIFLAQLFLKPRFKIDAVIMIICSIVIIINSVLTLQVSTADDCGPCKIKVATNLTRRVHFYWSVGDVGARVCLPALGAEGSNTSWGVTLFYPTGAEQLKL